YNIFPQGNTSSFAPADWLSTYSERPFHREVQGQTALILGLGSIGKAVAMRLRALGMRLIAVSRDGLPRPEVDITVQFKELDSVLPQADVVVLALPLLDATRGLIGQHQLSIMKSTALLVNVGRAQLIDEDALFVALTERRIGRAALDVWYAYPTQAEPQAGPAKYPFWTLDNVRATPHIS